jgi:hypothetical protein
MKKVCRKQCNTNGANQPTSVFPGGWVVEISGKGKYKMLRTNYDVLKGFVKIEAVIAKYAVKHHRHHCHTEPANGQPEGAQNDV